MQGVFGFLAERDFTRARLALARLPHQKPEECETRNVGGTFGAGAGLRLLEEQVQATERFEQFLAEARQTDKRMQEGGIGYLAADVHEYLEAKITGPKATRPKPMQWRK